jgi:hypothetical protein
MHIYMGVITSSTLHRSMVLLADLTSTFYLFLTTSSKRSATARGSCKVTLHVDLLLPD